MGKFNDIEIQVAKLYAKATILNAQVKIAKEGLKTIINSNDPMGIAKTTLKAMGRCVPVELKKDCTDGE